MTSEELYDEIAMIKKEAESGSSGDRWPAAKVLEIIKAVESEVITQVDQLCYCITNYEFSSSCTSDCERPSAKT